MALSAEYVFERFERDEDSGFGFTELDTHRVPLGSAFFHPSGFSASLTATYWNQEGTFERFAGRRPPVRQRRFLARRRGGQLPPAEAVRLHHRRRDEPVRQNFKFFDVDFKNPTIQPERTVFARLTIAFP